MIDFGQPDKLNILDDVSILAAVRKNEVIGKRWKIRKLSGKNVILRDVFDKIGFWVKKFREIGDVAVQYDPMHAALPWAGIRLLLQVTSISLCYMLAVGVVTCQ